MQRVPAIVIGAGQAGLAMSHSLNSRGVDHVVLERGRVAERWRSERWDLLRLLTPNWMTRLPGWSYRGGEPDGFMAAAEFVRYLEGYAGASHAPIQADTEVLSVRRGGASGFRVDTSRGAWDAGAVVVATGHCDVPAVPAMARVPAALHPPAHRRPTTGTPPCFPRAACWWSAPRPPACSSPTRSGARAGRSPSRWAGTRGCRGATAGATSGGGWSGSACSTRRAADVPDLRRARNQPSFQLVGRPDGGTLDLGTLRDAGVRLLGRAVGADGAVLRLRRRPGRNGRGRAAGARTPAGAHRHRGRRRRRPAGAGRGARLRPRPVARRARPRSRGHPDGDLGDGLRAELRLAARCPSSMPTGEIVHDGGVTPSPGLYVLGLRFLRRRRSNFIDGVGRDAEELAGEVLDHLAQPSRIAA